MGAVFTDTWGWFALGHRRAAGHQQVVQFYRHLRSANRNIVTSDYVLDEVITLIFRRESFAEAKKFDEGIFAAADQRQLTIERITSQRFASAWILRLRYQDKPLISFTDLTSMVVMHKLGIDEILTEDEHFTQVGMGFRKVP